MVLKGKAIKNLPFSMAHIETFLKFLLSDTSISETFRKNSIQNFSFLIP